MAFDKLKAPIVCCAAIWASTATCAASEAKAQHLFEIAGLPVTNSMLTTWVFTAVIIILFRMLLRGGAKKTPSKGQLVIEGIVETIKGTMQPIMGRRAFEAAFPLLLGFFCYILVMNWSGLLPGVGSITFNSGDGAVPIVRPANSDLNTTLALAMISFGAWIYFVWKFAGPKAFLKETFGNKANPSEVAKPVYIALFAVFFAVGCIDIISIIMRLISLSFRLYGNNFGGEVLMENMHEIAISLPRFVSWVIPLPFYILEMLIGLIQALLFTLLTAVYIGLLTAHEQE